MENACSLLQGEEKSQCTKKKAVVKSSRNIYKLPTNGSKYKRATVFRDTTPIHKRMILVLGHNVVSTA